MHHRTIIMACSMTKLTKRTSAARLYTGVVWAEWRRHAPADGMMPRGWSMMMLSAGHGLIHGWEGIDPYDRRLTRDRIVELAPSVSAAWAKHSSFARRHDRADEVTCCVVGGEPYQDLALAASLPVALRIDGTSPDGKGSGIGVLRQRVRRLAEHVSIQLNRPEEDLGYERIQP